MAHSGHNGMCIAAGCSQVTKVHSRSVCMSASLHWIKKIVMWIISINIFSTVVLLNERSAVATKMWQEFLIILFLCGMVCVCVCVWTVTTILAKHNSHTHTHKVQLHSFNVCSCDNGCGIKKTESGTKWCSISIIFIIV